ncbi:LruC domain-containing protein [Vibrio profundum]|uniref:LruC domain-containing protein n=1 Tax=Vibrio profundum TaxID=2910247 RepID=UPI003D0AF540
MVRVTLIITSITLLIIQSVYAAPFDTCPSKAYLFQANPVQVYGVNLVTGDTALIQADTGISANINGVGFDFEDRYIYGYDTSNRRLVRLGNDLKAEILTTSGLPTDHTFYVGDVYGHVYYLYRRGKGLFKVDLSPLDDDPQAILYVEKISSRADVNLTDFAFHPQSGHLYGVDNSTGNLYRFDTTTGQESLIGDVGETGTFGAGYFDVNGYYYISRNSDGDIFRIDLSGDDKITAGEVTAVKFADGPYSNQNDGARCANAPIIDEDSTIDFGDAPDTYLTTLDENGPRHGINSEYWLGNVAPDGEGDGLIAPLDDNKAGNADEDGVGFVTAVEAGLNSVISVTASRDGYLSAWIDWNKDGDFSDEGEKVFSDRILSAGRNSLTVDVPPDVTSGSTWSRFRFSGQQGLDYFGGAATGEVEDHPVLITKDGVAIRHYPSESTYATIAYEDNWPYKADYDMNDVVMRYRVTETVQDGNVARIIIQGYLAAYGAGYRNAFAIQLSGLSPNDIDQVLTTQTHNGALLAENGLELDSSNAVFIISNDMSVFKSEMCFFYRSLQDCQETIKFSFQLDIAINDSVNTSSLIAMPYDPFVFATPGQYHGEGLPLHPGRSLEIHLADHAPTEKFDSLSLYGLGADQSDPALGKYFKTSNNHPWALLVPSEWKWPRERVDLIQAYPQFADYAESGGQWNQKWHLESNANTNKIFIPEE